MGNVVSSALTDAWFVSHQRRVQKWLNNATEDSVLDTLTSSFFPNARGYGGLPATRNVGSYIEDTFAAYGPIDPVDGKRYWRETDLYNFLANRFPVPELQASIPVLWRCFHFHAYFPFPQKADRLDYSAFQRAIALLAADGKTRLGDNADGITMDADRYPDANARASKRLWLMFKSLSVQLPYSKRSNSIESPSVPDLPSTEEHLMDVLCLTQPDNACIMPAPIEDLRPHAARILGPLTEYTCSSVPHEDFLSLLKLILSIQLDKPEWGPNEPHFHTGRILTRPNPDILQGAADAIMRRATSDEKMDIDWHVFKNILTVYLPDFTSQFRLIFTPFLSPLSATSQALNMATPKSIIPVPYAQYLSLFLHPPLSHPSRHVFEDFARQEAHYALQTTQAAYSASPPALNTTTLISALSPIKTGTLLLITGETAEANAHPVTRVTVGACMPTPWDIERRRSFRASPPQKLHRYTPDHTLFQLEPRLEILRPNADAWIMDLIHVINGDAESGRKGGLRFGAEDGRGLSVDFDSGTATLRNVTTIAQDATHLKQSERNPSPRDSAYHSISPSANGEKHAGSRETSMRIRRLEIFDLGGHATAPFEEELAEKPQLRSASPPPYRKQVIRVADVQPKPQIGEEELRKRIQGFGPGV